MAKIIYQPHCSDCGAVIFDDVAIRKTLLDCEMNLKQEITDIEPFRCPVCGNMFETIEIRPPREEISEIEYGKT